ncbi:MAG: ArsR family transcriptional regulator [Candidatus Aegiribacteria sp.]|nr:ArsR family transcriptional regulator [Candidatus Aegiribacteria sp.]
MLLGSLFVSEDAERVLLFLTARGEGYAKEISDYYQRSIFGIQKQLEKFDAGGVLISRKIGRTRLYRFNPRYPLLDELRILLKKAIQFLPEEEIKKLTIYRSRPRRKGKTL